MNPDTIQFIRDHLSQEWEVECSAIDSNRLNNLIDETSAGNVAAFQPTKSGEHINIKEVLEVVVLGIQFILAVIEVVKALAPENPTPVVMQEVQSRVEAKNPAFAKLSPAQRKAAVANILNDQRLRVTNL